MAFNFMKPIVKTTTHSFLEKTKRVKPEKTVLHRQTNSIKIIKPMKNKMTMEKVKAGD